MSRVRERDVRKMLVEIVDEPDLGFGIVHSRGKHAADDVQKVLMLQEETKNKYAGDDTPPEVKGLFIMPAEFGVPGDPSAPQVGISIVEAWRSYSHEITWIMERRDERGTRDGDPNLLENLPSFDYFVDRLDLFLELFDLNMSLQIPNGQGFHTLPRTLQPLYDVNVSGVGGFHFAKLQLETRVKVPVVCR